MANNLSISGNLYLEGQYLLLGSTPFSHDQPATTFLTSESSGGPEEPETISSRHFGESPEFARRKIFTEPQQPFYDHERGGEEKRLTNDDDLEFTFSNNGLSFSAEEDGFESFSDGAQKREREDVCDSHHRTKPQHLVAKRNARERRRVQAVNAAFARLRRVLPFAQGRSKRISKVRTLHEAISYIDCLQRTLRGHDMCPKSRKHAYKKMQDTHNGEINRKEDKLPFKRSKEKKINSQTENGTSIDEVHHKQDDSSKEKLGPLQNEGVCDSEDSLMGRNFGLPKLSQMPYNPTSQTNQVISESPPGQDSVNRVIVSSFINFI